MWLPRAATHQRPQNLTEVRAWTGVKSGPELVATAVGLPCQRPCMTSTSRYEPGPLKLHDRSLQQIPFTT
jgi:hypothetical protein